MIRRFLTWLFPSRPKGKPVPNFERLYLAQSLTHNSKKGAPWI
jgi:hypothetical protein